MKHKSSIGFGKLPYLTTIIYLNSRTFIQMSIYMYIYIVEHFSMLIKMEEKECINKA